MNCIIFSDLVRDISSAQIIDAATRTEALAHAEKCLSCGRQLQVDRALTVELRELVSATKDCNASPRVWDNLSAAFDEQAGSPAAKRLWWYYGAAAIAAMLLLAFAIFSINRRPRATTPAEVSIPARSLPSPDTLLAKDEQVKPIIATLVRKPQPNRPRHLVRAQPAIQQVEAPKEIVTDFIQLTYGDPGVGGGAQLVRVELPRSAMASFGLPVNVNRSDERVKADVLMGADGLAHAIRFVQ